MAGPSNPHARVATSDLAAKGISGQWDDVPGQMPDGAVIIAAITSCTNTSNPRNVIAAGLLARNANKLGLTRKPWVKIVAGAGFENRRAVPRRSRADRLSWSSSVSASSPSPAPPATACPARSIR